MISMSSQKPIILLDVHMEGLYEILSDKGWNVETVTEKLGSSKEDRSDTKIIQYAKNSGCIVVTEDKKLIRRCNASEIEIITVEIEEIARTVHEKLRSKFS